MINPSIPHILAGDIGGTNTRLALFNTYGELQILTEEKYRSRDYESLQLIVAKFLAAHPVPILTACFGIAGPVRNGQCKATNLPWMVDAKELSIGLQIPTVRLYNDLEANANGIKVLQPEELYCLQKGSPQIGHQGLISAGTGLGEAGLFWDGMKHHPLACEGGHTDFGPRNSLEVELLQYLREKFGHVSYERIISGPGIHTLYQFLTEVKGEPIHELVQSEMKVKDPTAVICEFGANKKDPVCVKTLDWFLSLYGSESGNLALKFLALGGLYIGGGIAPRLLGLFQKSDFLASFANKGRFQSLLESIPIHIILNDHAALLGAAAFARE